MALIKCPDCNQEVSDQASTCIKCGRPMQPRAPSHKDLAASQRKPEKPKGHVSGGFVLFVFICMGVWIWHMASSSGEVPAESSTAIATQDGASQEGNPTAPAAAKQLPVLDLSPAEIYQRYQANEVAADQSWAGHLIRIKAPIDEINKDFTNDIVLNFSTGADFSPLQADIGKDQENLAASLSKGQVVTVICAKLQRVVQDPIASDCKLIQ